MREWFDDATIVAVPMDPQLEEIVKQIADAVEKRVSRRFDEFGARFDEVNGRLDAFDTRFDEVNGRLDAFDARFDEVNVRFVEAEGRLVKQFTDAEGRLVKQFADAEGRLVKQFADTEGRLAKQFADAEGRLGKRFDAAENRLAEGAKAHMEELRTLVKLSAEGYGATLENIERQLRDLNTKVDTKFADHAKILKQHTVEINALKLKQPSRRTSRR